MDPSDSVEQIRLAVRQFADDRNWGPEHTPKNLAMALAGEVGELLAELQWLSPEESLAVRDGPRWEAVRDEMADVFLYLVRLADVYDLDLLAAARDKLERNGPRWPIDAENG